MRITALAQAYRAPAQTVDCSDRPHQMLEAPSIEPSAAASDPAACAGPTRRTRTGTNDWPGQHFSCATAAVQWRLRNGVSARLLRRIRGRGATQPRCIHARAARALSRGGSPSRGVFGACSVRRGSNQYGSSAHAPRMRRRCTAHTPQMHRAYAADAPCQAPYLPDCSAARRLVGSVFTASPLEQGLASALFGRLGWTRNDVRIRGPRLSLRVDGRDDDAKAVSGVEVAAEDPRMVCGAHQGTERKIRQAFRGSGVVGPSP